MNNYMDPNYQNYQNQSSEPLKPGNDRNRLAIIIMVVLLFAGVAGFGIFYYLRKESIGSGEIRESASSFFPFIPIWIAIFIPALIKKKNKNQEQTEKQKRAMIIILIATLVLVVAGLAAWLFYANT